MRGGEESGHDLSVFADIPLLHLVRASPRVSRFAAKADVLLHVLLDRDRPDRRAVQFAGLITEEGLERPIGPNDCQVRGRQRHPNRSRFKGPSKPLVAGNPLLFAEDLRGDVDADSVEVEHVPIVIPYDLGVGAHEHRSAILVPHREDGSPQNAAGHEPVDGSHPFGRIHI